MCFHALEQRLPECHFLSEHQWLDDTPHGSAEEGNLGQEGYRLLMNSETGAAWLEGVRSKFKAQE